MLHILLLILKIIGIVLLVLIGIVLFAVISLLVVPLRYSADGSGYLKGDGHDLTGHALISWFLHAVTVRLSYEENKLLIKVKLFFFTVYEMTMPEEETGTQGGPGSGGWSSDTGQGKTVTEAKETVETVKEVSGRKEEAETAGTATVTEESPSPEEEIPTETGITEEEPEKVSEEITGESSHEVQKAGAGEESKESPGKAERSSAGRTKEKRPGFFERILNGFNETMTKIFDRIDGIFDWLNRLLSGEIKIIPEDNAVTRLMDFWDDDANKATVRLVTSQVKKMLKHILPREAGGNIRAGFDDPAATGTMLAAIAPFYGLYGKSFSIDPSFNETVLEGDIKFKGHIRAVTLIWIVLTVFKDRNFRRIISEWRKGGTGNG